MDQFKVIDDFLSWQGEGRYTGLYCYFIRFKRCNLFKKCILHPCDTFSMMQMPEYDLTFDRVLENASKANNNVVITGGEPSLYIDTIIELYKRVLINCFTIIETNGYQIVQLLEQLQELPYWQQDRIHIAYSPKTYNPDEIADVWYGIKQYRVSCDIKFVVGHHTEQFIGVIDSLCSNLKHIASDIWLMPYGDTIELMRASMAVLKPIAEKHSLNISDRLHIALGLL